MCCVLPPLNRARLQFRALAQFAHCGNCRSNDVELSGIEIANDERWIGGHDGDFVAALLFKVSR